MSEDAALQARIVELAGRINRQKAVSDATTQTASPPPPPQPQPQHFRSAYNHHWAPYAPSHRPSYKNRSLVNMPAPSTNPNDSITPSTNTTFVKTQGRNNQLMTQATYDREQQARRTLPPPAKRARLDNEPSSIAPKPLRTLQIEGITFEMKEDGTKLTRMDDPHPPQQTPRRAVIAGVEYLRTKNGNLLRQGLATNIALAESPAQQPRIQCANLTKNGTCQYGPKCRFEHDPKKVAICKTFLQKGNCPYGEYCDFSHNLDYHRVPACTHFQRDACNNDGCRYPHVRVIPGAEVCRAFAVLGYCHEGINCDKRHVFECPDYANTGVCPNIPQCRLTHIMHAGKHRAARRAAAAAAASDSEVEEDIEAEDVKHNAARDTLLADNADYIALSE